MRSLEVLPIRRPDVQKVREKIQTTERRLRRYQANLEKYIFPALMGFQNDEDLKQFKTIEFVKMPEERVTYTIEQNQNVHNEQEIQPVPRQSGAVLHYV